MKSILITLLIIFLGATTFAQTGISGGMSLIKAFGVPKAYPGLHFGFEIPRDDEVSYFARITATLANPIEGYDSTRVEAIDPSTTFPGVLDIDFQPTYNYINIEGGTRYYLGSGYDYGFSVYGGSLFMLSINSIKARYGDYDESKYTLPDGFDTKGRILGLNLGLNAGVKNHFSFGMLYFDITFAYSLFAIPNNALAQSVGGQNFSPLNFAFNLGFRKDLY